jgi:D-lactate dehydrogenase
MPRAAGALPSSAPRAQAAAVYLPACVNRIFAPEDGTSRRPLPQALVELSARAGLPLWIPPDVAGVCCGTPWASKGFTRGHAEMARHTAEALLRWTDAGRLPLLCDASSCTLGLLREIPPALDQDLRERFGAIELVDSVEWARGRLLERLEIRRRLPSVAVHVPCAAAHLGLREALLDLARALADEVEEPAPGSCCGTAGDRGLLHPELPASALAAVRERLAEGAQTACLCSNRTCEMGLTQATSQPFGHVVAFLADATL